VKVGPGPRGQQISTIVFLLIALVAILTMRGQCARGTATLFQGLDAPADAGPPRPR
jgi:hypothetical protein